MATQLMNDRRREEDERPAIEVVQEYLELRAEKARIEERLEVLKDEVWEIVSDEPAGRLVALGSELRVDLRRTWKFSPEVQALEDELRRLKAHEKATKVAVIDKTAAVLSVHRENAPSYGDSSS